MRTEFWQPRAEDLDFDCLYRVELELQLRGFSIGPLERDRPRGIMPAGYDVQKWRNLSKQDRAALVGVMTFTGGPRRGGITVTWADGANGVQHGA